MNRQPLRAGLAATTFLFAAAFGWTVAPPLAHAEPECVNSSNDFNSDGGVDVPVGMPGANGDTGAVEVRVTDGDGTNIHRIEPPNGQPGDRFGAAVAEVASANGVTDQDQCTQLVVGAPGTAVAGNDDAGAFYLYRWDFDTNEFALAKKLTQETAGVPGDAQAGATFGAALAAEHHGPGTGPVVTPLYVGAPGYTVAGAKGAGAFVRLTFSPGADDPTVDEASLKRQGVDDMPGGAEAGDAFGASLATTGNGVLAGAPNEDVGSRADAGGFIRWRENDSGDARFITQNTSGVPGGAEAGDMFGAAIYSAMETEATDGGHYVLVGAPGEAIGSVRNAGAAVRFTYHGDFHMNTIEGYSQETPGFAGHAETGDRFGSSFGSYGLDFLLTGVPGEDVGDVRNAGLVQSLRGDEFWHQGTPGIPGAVEATDRFGQTIGNALYGAGGSGEDGWLGDVLVGVTGENDGSGVVMDGLGGPGGSRGWVPQNPEAGDDYGRAIGKTN